MNVRSNLLLKKTGLVLIVLLGLYLVSNFLESDSDRKNYSNLSFTKKVVDFLLNLVFCYIVVEILLIIDKWMNTILPWTKSPIKRLILQTCIQVIFLFTAFIVFGLIIYIALGTLGLNFNELTKSDINAWYFIFAIIIFTLIISTSNTVIFLAFNWKTAVLKAAESEINVAKNKQQIAEAELQVLRLQLDPHFLFNNLSVLSELILKDQKLGYEFSENLAKVFRYFLLNSKKTIISLKDELRFLDAYLFLLKKRYGDGVIFEINVDVNHLEKTLPPITLQLLVENAIKHNRIDKENPLLIKIYAKEGNTLVVENNLLPLVKVEHSLGIGLENISNRYKSLYNKQLKIEANDSSFTVIVPLLT